MFTRNNYALSMSVLKDYMGLHYTGKHYDLPQNDCHYSLCALGANWLVRNHKCRSVMVERGGSSTGEMPDVIGFYFDDSFLIEAKMSRSDFLADASKPHRKNPETGMGKYRYYICPKGLISPDELPDNWGLLYVSTKGSIRKIKEATAFLQYNKNAEFMFLTSALATPWKLFQHWDENALQRLFRMNWMDKNIEVDVKLFAARLHANRLIEQETCED